MNTADHDTEPRFAFGENWRSFLACVNESHIDESIQGLKTMLGVESLAGQDFLDVGSGSGLSSLSARRLGARVRSFDYDQASVACTSELRSRYQSDDPDWVVNQGSVLDSAQMKQLGTYDIVYAWGVLHHTGHLWDAVANCLAAVRPGGRFFVAIYNDEGAVSDLWRCVKRIYCACPPARLLLVPGFFLAFFTAGLLIDLAALRNPAVRYREHIKYRGMSLTHDWLDWLGGYPYEPATPEAVIAFCRTRGFTLEKMAPPPIGFGNNQFVFRRTTSDV